MLVAILGTILPPTVVLSVISFFYNEFASNLYAALALKGMQAGVAAMLLDVVCGLGSGVIRGRSPAHILLMVAAFAAVAIWNVNVIHIILAAALIGICLELWRRWNEAGA